MSVDFHESQIHLADSLYKNYLPQYNFDEVKAAMEFFDSLRLTTDNSQRTTDFVHRIFPNKRQRTMCTVPEPVEGTTLGASTSSATAYPRTVDCCPLSVDYYEKQIHIADSLYKNYLPQYNFEKVKAAVEFFDSLRLSMDNGDGDGYGNNIPLPTPTFDSNIRLQNPIFLCAKAHYYHAVGLTEKDDIVGACEHYLTALEIMEKMMAKDKRLKSKGKEKAHGSQPEAHSSKKSVDRSLLTVDNPEDYEKIRFLALTYTRLGRLFYNENYCDLAILKYRKALEYIEYLGNNEYKANILKELGNVYQLNGESDSALYYYNSSLKANPDLTNKLDLEKNIAQILFDKGEKDSAYIMIKSNLEKLDNYRPIDSYYGILGIFYHEDEEYDSAIYYLEKCSESTNNYVRNASSIRLSAIYDSLGDLEKKAYYDNISSKLLIEKNNKETEHNKIQSVYNGYKERKQERINLANKKKITILLIFTFIAISIAILSIWYFSQKKNNILLGQIRTNKENYLKGLERVGKYNIKIIKQKEEEINKSKKEISKMRSKIEQNGAINLEAYYDSDICKKIIERKDTDFSSLKEDELALMLKYADKHLNNISGRLMKKFPSLNKNDVYTICLIILNIEKKKLPHLLNRDRKTIWDRLNKIKKLMGLEAKQDLFIHIKDNFLN